MEEKQIKKKSKTNWFWTIGGSLIATAIVLFLIFLMQGQTTVTGGYPESETSVALRCEATGLQYPIFTYDNTTSKNTEINVIFAGDDVGSISLLQTMNYNSERDAIGSEAINGGDMDRSFGTDLGPGALKAKYTIKDTMMSMSLYANSSDLNERTQKYFLIEGSPSGVDGYTKNYEKQGFKCVVKN